YALAQVAARDTAEGDIRLSRTVANLDTVVVKAQAPAFLHYAEFEKRRELGFGHFITYDQLEKQRGRLLSDVLRTTPGIRVQQIRVGRAYGYVAVSSRSNCLMQVYIDGIKVADRQRPPQNLDEFSVNEMGAVEIYSSSSDTPAEYGGLGWGCGTLLLWTRTR